jgi:hypothetical protein
MNCVFVALVGTQRRTGSNTLNSKKNMLYWRCAGRDPVSARVFDDTSKRYVGFPMGSQAKQPNGLDPYAAAIICPTSSSGRYGSPLTPRQKGQWNLEEPKLEFEELILTDAPIEITGRNRGR